MPHFLISLSYSISAKAALVANPTDRTKIAADAATAAGGRLLSAYATLGKHDMIAIVELPDARSVVAISAALGASGGFDSVETTSLLTTDELLAGLRMAGKAMGGYKPPAK